MAEEEDKEKEKSNFISGEELLKGVKEKEARELGFLLLGVVFGAALGILGNLWVAFFVELIRSFISPELWTVASFLGLVITTILSMYIFW
ncbi:MAG: hypothetical protein ACE5KD_04305 [Candidatus Bathyarchaeia archaeon]